MLNSGNEAATSLAALANKTSDCNYLILTMEEMLVNMKQQMMDKKRAMPKTAVKRSSVVTQKVSKDDDK